jgi:hypothetical protein
MSAPTSKAELIDAAMAELPSKHWRARRWTIATAVRYRRMTSKRGIYARAAKFADLHAALRRELEASRKLASQVRACTDRLHYALPAMRLDEDACRIVRDRVELAWHLQRNASELEKLESKWPKGGRGLTLATAFYDAPKEWLVDQCQKIFWHYGDTDRIRAADHHFHSFVGRVYDLATGQDPDADGVGLNKIVDKFITQWQHNERTARAISSPLASPPRLRN